MIPDDPGVVTEEIEEGDHHPPFIAKRKLRPLVDVADVDQERIRIFPSPTSDLSGATGESAKIGTAVVIECRKDMTMEVGRVQNRQPDDIRGRQRSRAPSTGEEGTGGATEQAQKRAAIWRENSHRARILTGRRGKTIFFAR